MERESIPGPPLNVMKSENDEEERKDDTSGPENSRRCESNARTLTSGFEPAEVVVIWIGKSVAGHKTSKKSFGTGYPCNRQKCRTPHMRDQGSISPFKEVHDRLNYLVLEYPHANGPKLLIPQSSCTSMQETHLLSTRFHQFVSYLS